MKIGLISDTHNPGAALEPPYEVAKAFGHTAVAGGPGAAGGGVLHGQRFTRGGLAPSSAARTVSRSLNDGEPTKLAIPSGTVDYLAMLYRLRLEKLANEPKVAWAVTDGKSSYQPRLNSVEREVITIGEKQYPAIRVEPDLGELRGVFNKSPDATVQIWFSDDTRQVPLRIRTKIYIGSFIANLKDYRPPTR